MTPVPTPPSSASVGSPHVREMEGFPLGRVRALLSRRERARVLMYHRIHSERAWLNVSPENFLLQMRLIKAFFTPLSLSELVACLRRGRPIPPRAVVITFDDGYRDNYEKAFPVLRDLGIPATFFVTTGLIESRQHFWWDHVRLGLKPEAELMEAWPEMCHQLAGLPRPQLVDRVTARLKEIPHDQARQLLKAICLPVEPAEPETMTWPQLRELVRAGMEVGSHTVSHPILAQQSREEAEWEIRHSKATLEQQLGCPVKHFAYPNGRPCDLSPEQPRILEQVGYLSACTTVDRFVDRGSSVYGLERIAVNGFDSPVKFLLRMAGLLR